MISIWRLVLSGVLATSLFVMQACTSCDEEGKDLTGAGTTPGTETQAGSGGTDPLGRPIGEDGLVEIEPGKKVLAGQPPGTGGITGSVSAEGVRGADAGGAQAAVRGGIRGAAERPISSPTQAVQSAQAPKRHPMGPNKRDKCAWFAKYDDYYCDVDCVQFDPDCQLSAGQGQFGVDYALAYYEKYGMGKDQGEFKDFSGYLASLPSGSILKEPSNTNMYLVCGHIEDHQGNGYCEIWQPYTDSKKHSPKNLEPAKEWQEWWDEATNPSLEVEVNEYLAAKNGLAPGSKATLKELGLKPPPEPEIAKCYLLDPDCAGLEPDPCIGIHNYGYGDQMCQEDCAMSDPDCVTGGEPQLIVGAEVCLEGTSFCTYTDENGEYKLVGVPPGEYVMIIKKQGKSGQTYAASQKVIVAADNVLAAGNKSIEETGSISGKVQRADAKNHLGTDVFVPGTSFTAKTDEQGNFILLGMPVGTYTLAAMFPGFETDEWKSVEVKAKTDTKVAAATLAHAPEDVKPRTVSGQVLDTDGAAVANAIISTTPESDKATTDLNGNFVLKGLQPTSYGIKAGKGGYTSSTRKVDLTTVENTDITIILTNFIGKTDNEAPQIKIAGAQTAQPVESVKLTAEVTDPDGTDLLFVKWSANGGSLSSTTGAGVNWTAPAEQGVFVVSATVTDGTAAAFAYHPITSAKGGALLSIDTSRPYQPKANLLSVASNAPGTEDSITGSAGAVEAGTTLKIYADGLLQTKVGEGTVASDGSFGPINVGDNKGDANDLLYLVVFDAFGNMSDRFFFLNDKTPPDTAITKQPCGLGTLACYVNSATATFELYVTEVGATLECSLDSAAYTACSTSQTYSTLSNGTHSLQVRATDAAKNVDPTPAVYSWGVDTSAPQASSVVPSNTATSTHVDGAFDLGTTFTDVGAGIVSCQTCLATDGTCDSEWTTGTFSAGTCSATGLTCTDGQSLTLNMRATDGAGSTGTGTAVTRTCDTTSPSAIGVKDALTTPDRDFLTDLSNLYGNWPASSDAGSGIDRYEVAFGTTGCTGANPGSFATAGTSTSASSAGTFTAGTNYFVNVKTFDKVGNNRCDSSDGALVVSPNAAAGTADFGKESAMVLDGSDMARAVYVEDTGFDNLLYTERSGGSWSSALTLETASGIMGFKGLSMAVDGNGRLHVLFHDVGNGNLRYATCPSNCTSGASWSKGTVEATGTSCTSKFSSMVVTSGSAVHIAYRHDTGGTKYGTCSSSCDNPANWSTGAIDNTTCTNRPVSLARDSSGKLHVLFNDDGATFTNAQYGTCTTTCTSSANWTFLTLTLGLNNGARVVEQSGTLHALFSSGTDVKYRACSSSCTAADSNWTTAASISQVIVGDSTDLEISSSGVLHAAFYDTGNGDLGYSRCSSSCTSASGWTTSAPSTTGNVGQYCSLSLDSSGAPHISFYDVTNTDLKYLVVP
ncbi:MAG: carboxypeptidase regulatory-like domain-containing protein [Nitrospirae bacterium]|nr:carboxypeptidase regulatory-like domain-containing protein [Nitrospirota bacterium]